MNNGVEKRNMLEIRNVPTQLILYAICQWNYNGKYANATGMGNNTNSFIKAVAVWLILKSETTSGCIHNYREQLPALASKCKMSVRTLEKYINELRSEELAFKEGNKLLLHNYSVLRKYDISIKEREPIIFYDTENKTRLFEILISIGLQRLKDKRMIMYWKKVNKNPDEFSVLSDLMIKYGADKARLTDKQYFRECHLELLCQSFEEETPGQENYELLHKRIKANPDLNARQSTYGRRMGYSVYKRENKYNKKDESLCMGFSHLIKRLSKKGLVTAERDHIEGWNRARKDEKIFHHRWLKKFKHTIWFRCNQLTINNKQFFKITTHEKAAA